VPLSDVVVYVDPLDATKEFTLGFYTHVTLLIGVAVKGLPTAGVIYQPWSDDGNTGRLCWGLVGYGAQGLIPNNTVPRTINNMIVATTKSHPSKIVEDALEKLKPGQILRVGGCGYKILLVIEGKADLYVYPSPGTKKWDTCAPEAVLRSVGGILVDPTGKELNYSKGLPVENAGILAALDRKCIEKFFEVTQKSQL